MRLNVELDPVLYSALRRESRKRGKSISDLVRDLVLRELGACAFVAHDDAVAWLNNKEVGNV